MALSPTIPTAHDFPSTRPHISDTTTKDAMTEELGFDPCRLERHHTKHNFFTRLESCPHLSNTSTRNARATGVALEPRLMGQRSVVVRPLDAVRCYHMA